MSDNNENTPITEEDILDDILKTNGEDAGAVDVPNVPVIEEPTAEEIIQATVTVDEQIVQQSDEAEDYSPKHTNPNVKEYFQVLGETTQGSPDTIELPPDTFENVIENIQRAPNLDTGGTEKARHWNNVMQQSLTYMPFKGMYVNRLNDQSSNFSQVLEYGGDRLYGAAPSNRNKPGVTEVEGERAILKLVTQLGIGGLHRTPLYNSGFWVYFKPAAETELLELNAIISQEKISLGRDSYGLAHTNHVSFALSRVFELALRHVYETSVKQSELPLNKLGDHIAPQDIHAFIWGFLCANYPSGFHYERACSNNPTKCNHVVKGNLSIPKTLVVDTERLNDWQKNHMRSFAAGSMTLADIKRYYSELTHLHNRRIILNKGTDYELAFTLRTPTIRQYIDQGFKYINALVESVNRSLSIDISNDQRDIAIDQNSRAEKLCQWIHFFESIEFGNLSDESNLSASVIKDHDTIVRSLATLSSTDSISEQIINEVVRYVEDSTISIMAIPAYDCPACGTAQEQQVDVRYPRMAAYIPLDILQVFFGLLARRMNRIMNR